MTGRQTEGLLLNKWLWAKHRESLQWKHPRLGYVPDHKEAKMYSVLLRWVDAIFIENGVVYLVEAKLTPEFGAVGQLEGYGSLFRSTPEFAVYRNASIQLVLLTTSYDANVADLCREKDIIYEVFPLE